MRSTEHQRSTLRYGQKAHEMRPAVIQIRQTYPVVLLDDNRLSGKTCKDAWTRYGEGALSVSARVTVGARLACPVLQRDIGNATTQSDSK